jgi:hypothetical protein
MQTAAVHKARSSAQYNVIGASIHGTVFKCGNDHHGAISYCQDRLRFYINVDDEYYRAELRNGAAAIISRDINDCQEHYERSGLFAGGFPCNDFSRFQTAACANV